MSKQREVRLIIRELMDKPEYKHLSYNDILNAVYYAQFGFIHEVMTTGDRENVDTYKGVPIQHFGRFIAHPKRVNELIKYFKEKKDNEGNSEQLSSEE